MDDFKDDIEKYLQGELTPQQMHWLEKKALDDPFLADALEGGTTVSNDDFAADVEKLNIALKERVEPDKKIIIWWHLPARIAAGIIVTAITGYVIYNLIQKENIDSPLALNKPEATKENKSQSSNDARINDSTKRQTALEKSPTVQNQKGLVSEPEVSTYSTPPSKPINEVPSPIQEDVSEEEIIADDAKVEAPRSGDQPTVNPISPRREEAEKKAESRNKRKEVFNADEGL